MRRAPLFLLCLIALTVAAAPARTSACSWLAAAIKSSLPTSGATDVPIDVAPIIRGSGNVNLLRWETLDGEPVAFETVIGPSINFTEGSTTELVPRGLLQPNTTYVIRAHLGPTPSPEEQPVVFTTGSATADADLSAPPTLAATVLRRGPNMCNEANTASCISGGEQQILLELLDASGKKLVRDVVSGDVLTYVTNPHCIRASVRSASGKLSEASEVCGKELEIRQATNELDGTRPCRAGKFQAGPPAGSLMPGADAGATAQDLGSVTAGEADPESDAGGCALGGAPRASTPAVALLLGLTLFRRRGSRRRGRVAQKLRADM